MTCVTDRRDVHVGVLISHFDSLELSVMEISRILQVSGLRRVHVFSQPSEVSLVELVPGRRRKPLLLGGHLAFFVLGVDGTARNLGEALAVEVLTLDLGHEACIAGDVLRLDIVVGSAKPVLSLLGVVAILHLIVIGVHRWLLRIEVPLRKRLRLAHNCVHVVIGGLFGLAGDDLVDVASRAAVDVVFERYVAGVAG